MLAGSYLARAVRYLLDVLLIGWKIHLSYCFLFLPQGHYLRFGKGRRGSKCPSFLRFQPGSVHWQLLWWPAVRTALFPSGASQVAKGLQAISVVSWDGNPTDSSSPRSTSESVGSQSMWQCLQTARQISLGGDLGTYLCVGVIWGRSTG